jgi:nucleotide-binding universal stress UspA family protein
MWQPVLVPLDGSPEAEQALPYAEALAAPGCQLILLEVGEDPDDEFALLERHADSCAHLETASGDPAEQILRVVRDLGVGMIVMTTHGRGALGRLAFGSVADAVTRHAPVPAMVVRPGEAPSQPVMRRLVVPLDGSPLSETALPFARSLAQRLEVPVRLITAVDPVSLVPSAVAPALAFDAEIYDKTLATLRSEATSWLNEASKKLRKAGIDASWEILSGSPYAAIIDILQPGDVVVMASHGRSGVKRMLLGSVAEKLTREAPVPVVIVPTGDRRDGRDAAGGVACLTASAR